MKKFNANGVFRKDTQKETNEHDLNSYKGQSLEESTEMLEDTTLLSEEELEQIKAGMTLSPEEREELLGKQR